MKWSGLRSERNHKGYVLLGTVYSDQRFASAFGQQRHRSQELQPSSQTVVRRVAEL